MNKAFVDCKERGKDSACVSENTNCMMLCGNQLSVSRIGRARLLLTSGWRLGEKQNHWPWHEFWRAPKRNFWWCGRLECGRLVERRHGYFWVRLKLEVVELTQWQGLARFHHWSRTWESGKHRMLDPPLHWFCWYTLCRCHGSPPQTTCSVSKPDAKKKKRNKKFWLLKLSKGALIRRFWSTFICFLPISKSRRRRRSKEESLSLSTLVKDHAIHTSTEVMKWPICNRRTRRTTKFNNIH